MSAQMYSQIYLSIYLCSCLVPIYVLENLLSDTITQFNNVQLATIFPQSRTTSNPILTLANEIASPRLPAAAFRSAKIVFPSPRSNPISKRAVIVIASVSECFRTSRQVHGWLGSIRGYRGDAGDSVR